MARGKLRRFADLPTEIQAMIWEYAVIPRGENELSIVLLVAFDQPFTHDKDSSMGKRFFRLTSKKNLPEYYSYMVVRTRHTRNLERTRLRVTALARTKLMRVCSLSKQVVLESWKNDLAGILNSPRTGEWEKRYEATMAKVAEFIDGLIR